MNIHPPPPISVLATALYITSHGILLFFTAPIMGIRAYQFPSTATSQWLEQAVSPPRDLTAFTMIFQIMTKMHFDKPVQIACYGDQGDDCRLSVVINVNYTLEMIIGSTR